MELAVLGFMIFIVVIILVLVKIGMNKKLMYEQDMIYMESYVKNSIVNRTNYRFIIDRFDHISRNNQDEERTKKLWKQFTTKYRMFWYEVATSKVDTQALVKLQNKIA